MMQILVRQTLQYWKANGTGDTLWMVRKKLREPGELRRMRQMAALSDEERKRQQAYRFPRKCTISILTPLYNTPLDFLRQMIRSVQEQTYAGWELCLADGSDEEHRQVGEVCLALAKEDKRIKYKKLKENRGISANTNECIRIATGDYIALLDHDDALHPAALFEVMGAICAQQADFIYTDEAKFTDDVWKFFSPNFKPDFSKDELRAHNYICHLTVYSRELLERAGEYRSEYDGSQDHDIVLRMTERAERIVHIPKVLYFWRVHQGSVSAGVETKSYAVEAARNAVRAQLKRCGEPGKVSSVPPYQTLYKVDYAIEREPMVSVVLYGIESRQQLDACAGAMESMTRYYPMEVLLAEGSMEPGAFREELRVLPTVKPLTVVDRAAQKSRGRFGAAIDRSKGEYIAFLHASAVLETSGADWVREMLMFAQRSDVGAVGGCVCDQQGRHVLSGGVALDSGSPTLLHHMHRGNPLSDQGFEAALRHVRNVTAVDGACLFVSKEKLLRAGGLREELCGYQFADLCLRLREQGLRNVWTPFVRVRFDAWKEPGGKEREQFAKLWAERLGREDPYYNPNSKALKLY